jgi:hypothetical protein
MIIFVQFGDETEAEIIACFGSSQDPAVWPNQGVVDNDDIRWQEFTKKFPAGTFDNLDP